jgi:hypothetical protein
VRILARKDLEMIAVAHLLAGVDVNPDGHLSLASDLQSLATAHHVPASGDVRNFSLARASFALDGIDFAAGLDRLHHHWKSRAIAGRTRMLADFRRELVNLIT